MILLTINLFYLSTFSLFLWICILSSPNAPQGIISDASYLSPGIHIFVWDILPMIVVGIFTAIVLDIDDYIDVLDAENIEEIQVLNKEKEIIRVGDDAIIYELNQLDSDRIFPDDDDDDHDDDRDVVEDDAEDEYEYIEVAEDGGWV